MATPRHDGIVSIESQFPIVVTNLRALVSSWLPPARDPSPEEEDKPEAKEFQGRKERYATLPSRLTIRLALGATVAKSQPSSSLHQSRMNRKMGIPITGVKSETKKSGVNGAPNGKRKQSSSDSEDDSRSRLITKLSTKKTDSIESPNKKKKHPVEIVQHKALVNVSTSPPNSSLELFKMVEAITPMSKSPQRPIPLSPVLSKPPSLLISPSAKTLPLSDPSTMPEIASPPKVSLLFEDLPTLSQIEAAAVAEKEDDGDGRKRLKREKKREKKRERKKREKKKQETKGQKQQEEQEEKERKQQEE